MAKKARGLNARQSKNGARARDARVAPKVMAGNNARVAPKVMGGNNKGSAKQPALKPTRVNTDRPLSVVGIGASAGGLEAFEQLLRALPNDTGLAYVLVQHLAPSHESILSELLAKATKMPVV